MQRSKDDHRKGEMFSEWEKASAKDDTEPHVDRGHPEQNPPQFLLCSPIWDSQPRGLHLICLPRDTQYTPQVPAAQRLSFPKFPNIHLG